MTVRDDAGPQAGRAAQNENALRIDVYQIPRRKWV
jgi:hypothetical protein